MIYHPMHHTLSTAACLTLMAILYISTGGFAFAAEVDAIAARQTHCELRLTEPGSQSLNSLVNSQAVRTRTCACAIEADGAQSDVGVDRRRRTDLDLAEIVLKCALRAAGVDRGGESEDVFIRASASALRSPEGSARVTMPKVDVKNGCKPPEYPASARRAKVEGSTSIDLKIDKTGLPVDSYVMKSAGPTAEHKYLDSTTQAFLMQCNFSPALREGTPVEAWTRVKFVWKLSD